jgi:hypothetical protein
MKPVRLMSAGVLLLLLGAVAPTYARQDDAKPPKQEQQAKPEKQQEAKPEKQQEQAKPAKQQEQAKPAKQQEAKPEKQQEAKPAKQEQQQQAKGQQAQQQKQQQQDKSAKQEQQQQAKTQQAQTKSQNQQQLKQVKATRQDQQQQVKSQPGQAQGQWARNGQKDSRGHEYNESRFGRDHHTRFAATGGRMYNGRREYSFGGYWFYAGAYPSWFYQQDVYFIMGADGLWYAVAYGDPSLTFQVNIE